MGNESVCFYKRFSFEEMHKLRKILQKMERSLIIFDCIPLSKSNVLEVTRKFLFHRDILAVGV